MVTMPNARRLGRYACVFVSLLLAMLILRSDFVVELVATKGQVVRASASGVPGRAMKVSTAGLIALSGSAVLLAQQPPVAPPTFHADTDVVRLEVSVLDNERQPVRGLTAADFTVRENGRERPVVAFTPVDLPPATPATQAAAWVRHARRDVVSNTGPSEGRLVVIAFDWSIRFHEQATARRIAHATVDDLGPGDQAAIIFTSPSAAAGTPQNFTTDRALLHAAIDKPFGFAQIEDPRVPDNANRIMLMDPEGYETGECLCRVCSMEAMTRLANVMRSVSQRPKVVLFIGTYVRTHEATTSGPSSAPSVLGRPPSGSASLAMILPTASITPGACTAPLNDARDAMERAMAEANATIHVLDPLGLETAANTPLGIARRIRERQDSLPVIADLTGGRTVMSTNTPEDHVASILEETGSYYVLGFTPASTARDGRTNRIEVRVNRRNVMIKSRDRYSRMDEPVSALASPDAGLLATLGGVVPVTNVPLDVSVVPMVSGGGTASAAVVVARMPTKPAGPIAMLTGAFRPRGASVASRRVVLTPTGDDAGEDAGLGLVSTLALEPGAYEVRVATELQSGLSGSVNTFVDVPDFQRSRLSMSGVLLHVDPEETTAPVEAVRGRLPFVPTARRSFTPTDSVSAFVQISQGTTRTDALSPVALVLRITNTRDVDVLKTSLTLDAGRFASYRTGQLRLDVPTQELPPGDYLLSLETTMDELAATRTVRFQIR